MTGYRTRRVSELKPGEVLATPVFDDRFVKLLDKGAIFDEAVIDRLKVVGVTEVVVESSADAAVGTPQEPLGTDDPRRSENKFARTKPIEHCSICHTSIELQPPAPISLASTWICKKCGALYFGSEEGRTERPGIFRVDPAAHHLFVVRGAPSIAAENIQHVIKSLEREENESGEPDRRQFQRYAVTLPVVVLPLASDFRIDGDPMRMMTANISLGGAALIYTRFVNAPYLAIDFTVTGADSLQVVLKVLRVRSLGLVYEISGQFISRLAMLISQ